MPSQLLFPLYWWVLLFWCIYGKGKIYFLTKDLEDDIIYIFLFIQPKHYSIVKVKFFFLLKKRRHFLFLEYIKLELKISMPEKNVYVSNCASPTQFKLHLNSRKNIFQSNFLWNALYPNCIMRGVSRKKIIYPIRTLSKVNFDIQLEKPLRSWTNILSIQY